VNDHETDPLEEVDPSDVFTKLGFPKALIVSSESGKDERQSEIIKVPISSETEAKQSQEKIEWLRANHLLSHEYLKDECARAEQSTKSGVVAGFIPRRAVSFLIGDSGIGKSPLAYQLGLCVAAGVPFLGMETQAGLVIMCDYENGMEESLNLSDQLARFLKLPEVPKNFVVWSPDYSHTDSVNIERICETAAQKPTFVIVDSLRSHDPHFEKHEYAGEKMNKLNKLAYMYGTAILVIHHTRKPDRDNPVSDLDDDKTRVIRWLREAAGSGSLINQSHTRIAIDSLDGRSNIDAALVVRWYRKSKGEAGPLYLERVCDDSGEPFGYRPLTEIKLLGNTDQETALRNLPPQFTFKEAKNALKRSDDPTSKFLKKCISLSLVRQNGRGRYERTDHATEAESEVAQIDRVGRGIEKGETQEKLQE